MNIHKVRIENFMCIKLVEFNSDGAVVQLAGGNGQGKTSAMLAIIGALGGKKALAGALGLSSDPGDEEIIRRGEEMAEVVVEFGGWVVTWQRERGKSDKVEIRGTGGGIHGRAKLGELIGAIAFDPLELDGMSPAARRATLLEMAGIDLEEIDGRRLRTYQNRRDCNRDHKLAAARVGEPVKGAPKKAVDVLALEEKLENARGLCVQNDDQRRAALVLDDQVDIVRERARDVADEISRIAATDGRADELHLTEIQNMKLRHVEELERLRSTYKEDSSDRAATIAEANTSLERLGKDAEDRAASANAARKAAGKLVDPPIDPMKKEIESVREANKLHRLARERSARFIEARDLETESLKLTAELEEIDAEKASLLAAAKMPIEGLGVSEDDVTIDGHLWETANFSRRLRVCVAISAAMAGELKIAFVRSGGNDLDEKNYAAFVEECERRGLQPWIERNRPEGAGAIVIEAGLVAS